MTLGELETAEVRPASANTPSKTRDMKRLGLRLQETSDGLSVLDVRPG